MLEAPCMDMGGRLCFVDRTPPGRILRLEEDGSVTTLADRIHVGGLAPHAGGGLVASGRDVSVIEDGGRERVVLGKGDGWGFNDLGTDPLGAVFVGRFDTDPMPPALGQGGSLWRVAPGGSVAECYADVELTNGVRTSPDGSRLYHNDTTPKVVWVSDLSGDGMPVGRRELHRFSDGSPDGMAVDDSGCLWVALMGSGRFARLTPDGKEDATFEAPSDWAASCCFDGHVIYAVTFGGPPFGPPGSGGVYRATAPVAGATVHPARV